MMTVTNVELSSISTDRNNDSHALKHRVATGVLTSRCSVALSIVLLSLSITASIAVAQEAVPGTSPWTPVMQTSLKRSSIVVPAKYQSIDLNPTLHAVNIPEGWTASIFFAGTALGKPRFLAWGPDSVLYVANMSKGNVLAFPDVNRDGIADSVYVAASGFAGGHDVRFYRDTMFVSQTTGVIKLWRSSGSGYIYDQRRTIINKSTMPYQLDGNHTTRTLVIDSVHSRLLINVGSKGNADREMSPGRERAIIEAFDMDGSNRRIYATGIRNSVGMTLHPRTHRLWANNNGSDKQGNDVPGEWIDLIREGGFYGYPFAYPFRQYFDVTKEDYTDLAPITANDSVLVNTLMQPPAGLITAHSAPMAMEFTHPGVPEEFRNGAFVVLRGSWNRQPVTGAKLVFLSFDNDEDTVANSVQDVLTGFLPDSNNSDSRWARPVGLALAADGSIYLTSDDLYQFVMKLTPPTITHVAEVVFGDLIVSPNPATETCSVTWEGSDERSIVVRDITGRVHFEKWAQRQCIIDTHSIPTGLYFVTVRGLNTLGNRLLSVVH